VSEDGGLSPVGGGGAARGRAGDFFVVSGQAFAIFDVGDQRDGFVGAGDLCGDCAGSSADSASGFDGGALFVRAAAISARGVVEYDCCGGADFADLETF